MTHNPRPIIEWLNELPELIRELVIAEYVLFPFNIRQTNAKSMSDAIISSAEWEDSTLDYNFYDALFEDALYHEQNNIKLPR
jgi:hypothetical protein